MVDQPRQKSDRTWRAALLSGNNMPLALVASYQVALTYGLEILVCEVCVLILVADLSH